MRYQNNRAYENPYRQYQQSYNPYTSYFSDHPITGLTREEEQLIKNLLLTAGTEFLKTAGPVIIGVILSRCGVPSNVVRIIQRTIIELGNNCY